MKPPDRVHNGNFRRRPAGPSAAAPEPMAPGLAARIAAAQILADTLTMGRPLDERFSGDSAHAPAERHRHARSRPRPVDRHRFAPPARHHPQGARRVSRQGIAQEVRLAGMDADRRGGANPVSRHSRSRRSRPGGAGGAARTAAAPFAALVNAVLRNRRADATDILDDSRSRSMTTRRRGWRRAGAPTTARRRRGDRYGQSR